MALISTVCPECNSTIKVDDTKAFGFCMNCGAKIAINALPIEKQNSPGLEQMIKNYATLALNAKNAGNDKQCEEYCNKIIELDSTNAAAWMLKGSAAGWQSTLASLRIEEMLLCFQNAIQFSTDDSTKEKYKKMAVEDLKSILLGMISLQCKRFIKWPDAEEREALWNLHEYALSAIKNCIINIGFFPPEQFLSPAAGIINNAVLDAEHCIIEEYKTDNDGYPGDYAFKRFIKKMGEAYIVYSVTTAGVENDYEILIKIYNNMIANQNNCINARSYVGRYVEYVGWRYSENLSLDDSAIANRKKIINDLVSKKADAQRKQLEEKENAQRERNQQYWAAHADERERLESEKKKLEDEVMDLKQQISKADSNPAITDLKGKIETLRLERNALGMFKSKQKREIDAKIAANESDLANLIKRLKDPLQRQVDVKTNRISSIDNELNQNH